MKKRLCLIISILAMVLFLGFNFGTPIYWRIVGSTIQPADNTRQISIRYPNLNQVVRPLTPPSVAILAEAGNLNGTYVYRVTYVTANGETEPCAASSEVSPSDQKVTVSSIPTSSDSSVTARKLYRGADYLTTKYIATISDNSTTSYVDNIADAAYGDSPPFANTTGGYLSINGIKYLEFGRESIIMGINAGGDLQGPGNICIGPYSCDDMTTGYWNTAIGYEAGNELTTGDSNTFIGLKSGYKNTTGSFNTGVGLDAVNQNTTADHNTGIGYHALYYNQTGENNAALGSLAGRGVSGSSASQNVYFGPSAGAFNTGNSSIFIGFEAGKGVEGSSTGGEHTIIGRGAADAITTATRNVAIGINAGGSTTTGGSNTYIGFDAGYTATTATENIFLGYFAGWKETGSDTLIIDSQVRTDEAEGRAEALIYGIMAAEEADQELHINAKIIDFGDLPTYADNSAAVTGGLTTGYLYQTSGGELRIVTP